MRMIKLGNRGTDVRAWQTFLRGGQIDQDGECSAKEGDAIISDGIFGPITDKETRAWQTSKGLVADGIVGQNTWKAAVADSFPETGVPTHEHVDEDVDPDPTDVDDTLDFAHRTSPAWPPRPAGAKPLSKAERDIVLGKIEFKAAPTSKNPEAIKIMEGF